MIEQHKIKRKNVPFLDEAKKCLKFYETQTEDMLNIVLKFWANVKLDVLMNYVLIKQKECI